MLDFETDTIDEIQIGLLKVKTADITVEDMPTPIMKDVYELCGRDVAVKLLLFMQGNIIQVSARPWIKLQVKYIKENYDYTAHSIKKIARMIGTSEKFVRDILKDKIKIKTIPCEGQLTFDDERLRIQSENKSEVKNEQ